MASAEDVKNESCIYDPDFAVVCSFFANFTSQCGFQTPSISELQQMLDDTHHTAPELIDLHIRLMRKAKKNVNPDRWQKTLANFCYYAQPDDCWILEQKGYQCLSSSQKLKFLLTLIGAQFDLNSKFKTDINKLDVKELRLQPVGRDKAGNNYWAHMDKQTTLKVYKEDVDEEKWELIVQDREGLVKLLDDLMEGKDPNRKLDELAAESESSESSAEEEEEPDVQTEVEDEDDQEEENEVDRSSEHVSKKIDQIEKEPSKKAPAASTITPKPLPKDDSRRVHFAEKLQQAYNEGPLSKASLNLLTRPRSANTTTPVKPLDKEAFTQHLQKLDSINMLKPLLTSTEPGDEMNPASIKSDLLKAKINQKFSIIKPGLQTDIAKSKLEPPTKAAKPGLKLEQILKSKLAQKLSGSANLGEKIEEKKPATEQGESSVPKLIVPEPCKTAPEKPLAERRKPEDSSEEQPAKKSRIEESDDDGEEIEGPLMVVNGVGNGHDCNSGIPDDDDDGIEGPEMYFYGVGSGAECDTGNNENYDSSKNSPHTLHLTHKVDNMLDPTSDDDDEIEGPEMYFYGVGSGAECDTGNNENDDSSKNSPHTLHLTHKVDNMLKPASEGETTPSTSTGDIVDTEKKKPKLWTIDAICNSDSSKDSKRDSVPQFPNYNFNKETKPYHSASESYSIFSLTENKDTRDAASVIPTNFYFGSNNQNPCFLPAELSPTFKSNLHSVENIVESAGKAADVKVSKFSAENLYSKTNNVNDTERVERTPEVARNTLPETAPNDETDFRTPASQSATVETCEPQTERKIISPSNPRHEEEVAKNHASPDRPSVATCEAPVAVVKHEVRDTVCPQPLSPASSSASDIDNTPAAISDSEEEPEELTANDSNVEPTPPSATVLPLPLVAGPQNKSTEREPSNADRVENEADIVRQEVEPVPDIAESPKPIEVAEPTPAPACTENTPRELEAPVPRTEVVDEKSEQESKVPPPRVAEHSATTLPGRESPEPQLDAETQHSKLEERSEPSESAIIKTVDQATVGAMEEPLPVPTAEKCVPVAPEEDEVVGTVSTETETHKTDIEQKATDNETEREEAEKQRAEDGEESIQVTQSEQPAEKESLVNQEKKDDENAANDAQLLKNETVESGTGEIPSPARKETRKGKQKDVSTIPATSPVENDVQKKGESEILDSTETRRSTRSTRARKSDAEIVSEKVEKGKKASKKDDVESPAKKAAKNVKHKNEETKLKNEVESVDALKITIRTSRNKSNDNEKEVETTETSPTENVADEKGEEQADEPTEENDDAETASDKEETPKSEAKKPMKRGKKKKRVYNKKPAKPKTPKKEDEVAQDQSDGESTAKDDEQSNETDATPKKQTPEPKKKLKRGWLNEVDVSNITAVADSGTPGIRQSRRIAQLKIKEQAETKYQETVPSTKKSPANQKSKTPTPAKNQKAKASKGKFKPPKEDSEEETYYELPSSKKKGKKKKDLPPKKDFDPKKPWKQSSESSSEEEDEEDHYEEEEEEFVAHDKSDHEFSPESDIEDEDYAPVKRARTAHSKPRAEDKTELDHLSCQSCKTAEQPEWILLCDSCDEGWHAACLKPPVMAIPEGDWFCPPCQHNKLITGLQMFLRTYDKAVKKRVSEESRRKRLEFVNVSYSNVIQPESAPKQKARAQASSSSEESSEEESDEEEEPLYQLRVRRQANVRHRLNEYEELMNSAIQRENGDVPVAPLEPEQPAANVNGADAVPEAKIDVAPAPVPAETKETNEEEKKESDESAEDEEEDEDDEDEEKEEEEEKEVPIILQLRNVRKKPARLTNLDASSEDDHYSDEDFKGSSADDPDEDEEYAKSETDSDEASYRRGRGRRGPVRRSTRARRTRYDNDFINDESDDDEDEDDYGRKKKKKRISYAESESDEDSTWGRRKRKKNTQTFRAKPAKKRKRIKFDGDSDEDEGKKNKGSRNSRIKYGLDEDEDVSSTRRTRGKKINYQDDSDSDFEEDETSAKSKNKGRKILSDDEYENEEDDQRESAASENGEQSESGSESNESESAPKSKKAKILESEDSDSAPATAEKPPEAKPVELPTKVAITAEQDQDEKPGATSVITSTNVEQKPPLLPNNVVKDGPEAFVPKIDANPSLQGMQSMAQNLSHPLPPPQFPPNMHPDAAAFVGRPPQPAAIPVPVHYEMGMRFDSPDGMPPNPLQPGDKFPHPIRVPSPNKMYGLPPDMQAGNRPHLPPFPPQQMQPPIIGPADAILPQPGRPMPPAIPLAQMALPRPEGGRPMPPAMPIPQGPMTMPEGGRPMPPGIPLAQMQMLAGPDRPMLPTLPMPRGPMAMPGPPMHVRPQHLIGPPPNVNIAQCGPPGSMIPPNVMPPGPMPPNAMPPSPMPPNSMPSTPDAPPKRRPRGRGKKQLEMERLQREREAMDANRNEEMIPLHVLKMPPPEANAAAGHSPMPPRPPFSTYQQIPFSQAPSPVQQQASSSSSKRVKITPTRMRMPTPPDKIVHIPRASNTPPGMYPPGRHPSPLPGSSPSSGAPSPDGKAGPPVSGAPTTPALPPKSDAGPIRPESSEPQYYQHPPTPYPPSQGPRVYGARPEYAFARKPAPPGMYPPPAASTAPNVVVSRTGGFAGAAGPPPVSSPGMKSDSPTTATANTSPTVPQPYPGQYGMPPRGIPTTVVTSAVASKPGQSGPYIMSTRPMPPRPPPAGYPVPPHIKPLQSSVGAPPYGPYYPRPPYSSTSSLPPPPQPPVTFGHTMPTSNFPPNQSAAAIRVAPPQPPVSSAGDGNTLNSLPPTSQSGDYQFSQPQQTTSAASETETAASEESAPAEEASGEFGGLVSYFSSQREDDLDA